MRASSLCGLRARRSVTIADAVLERFFRIWRSSSARCSALICARISSSAHGSSRSATHGRPSLAREARAGERRLVAGRRTRRSSASPPPRSDRAPRSPRSTKRANSGVEPEQAMPAGDVVVGLCAVDRWIAAPRSRSRTSVARPGLRSLARRPGHDDRLVPVFGEMANGPDAAVHAGAAHRRKWRAKAEPGAPCMSELTGAMGGFSSSPGTGTAASVCRSPSASGTCARQPSVGGGAPRVEARARDLAGPPGAGARARGPSRSTRSRSGVSVPVEMFSAPVTSDSAAASQAPTTSPTIHVVPGLACRRRTRSRAAPRRRPRRRSPRRPPRCAGPGAGRTRSPSAARRSTSRAAGCTGARYHSAAAFDVP